MPGVAPLLFPEPPLAMLIRPHRPQEVYLAEGRPGHIAEIELAVGALPEEETGQADLTARPDDEIRIGRASRVEMARDGIARDLRDGVRYRKTPFRLLCEQGAHCIDNLVPTTIGDGDGEGHSFVGCCRFRGSTDCLTERRRHQFEPADRLHPHLATMELRMIGKRPDLRLNRGKNARDLFERTSPIVR